MSLIVVIHLCDDRRHPAYEIKCPFDVTVRGFRDYIVQIIRILHID